MSRFIPLHNITHNSCFPQLIDAITVMRNPYHRLQAAFLLLLYFATGLVFSLHAKGQMTNPSSRRQLLQNVITNAAFVIAPCTSPRPSMATEGNEPIEVWFGCGCFWHVQHEFLEAERKLLGRSNAELTSRAGYAGGKAGAKDGKVCYHNAAQISDYGSLGHAEVVNLKIPTSAFPDFVAEYCALFNKEGYRPDQFQDRGPEYRNLVGIPGGVSGPLAKQLVDASMKNGDKLDFAKGKGDDADARGLVFVMDTAEFPFFVAEQYHQFQLSLFPCDVPVI
jgi:peptide methionine sulfoxide reductase MsrA